MPHIYRLGTEEASNLKIPTDAIKKEGGKKERKRKRNKRKSLLSLAKLPEKMKTSKIKVFREQSLYSSQTARRKNSSHALNPASKCQVGTLSFNPLEAKMMYSTLPVGW